MHAERWRNCGRFLSSFPCAKVVRNISEIFLGVSPKKWSASMINKVARFFLITVWLGICFFVVRDLITPERKSKEQNESVSVTVFTDITYKRQDAESPSEFIKRVTKELNTACKNVYPDGVVILTYNGNDSMGIVSANITSKLQVKKGKDVK